jgi:hypothetical protein
MIKSSEKTDLIDAALIKFKGIMPAVKRSNSVSMSGKSKSGKDYDVNYDYAALEDIQEQSRKYLVDCHLTVNQFLSSIEAGGKLHSGIVTRIAHASGQYHASFWPIDVSRIERHQEEGSAITYRKRYMYAAALDIILEDEDDDANTADKTQAHVKRKDSVINWADLKNTVIDFGKKYKGKKFIEVPVLELRDFAEWISEENRKANKDNPPMVKAMLKYLEDNKIIPPTINGDEKIPF